LARLKHLAGNLYAVKGRTQTFSNGKAFILSNSLFIDEEGEKAIIDPSGDYDTMIALGEKHEIKRCFFSHSHLDHSSCFHYFRDADFYMHELEKITYPRKVYFLAAFNRIKLCREMFFWVFDNIFNRYRFLKKRMMFWNGKMAWVRADSRFTDGDEFRVGNTFFRVVHLPGHSTGHCGFYFPKEKVFYSADFDLSVFGPLYGEKGAGIDDYIMSAEKIKSLDIEICLTGHMKWIVRDNLEQRIEQYINMIYERDERILAHLKRPKTVKQMYHNGLMHPTMTVKNSPWMRKNEIKMLNKHFLRLESGGLVRRLDRERWIRTDTQVAPEKKGKAIILDSIPALPVKSVRICMICLVRAILRVLFRIQIKGLEKLYTEDRWIVTYSMNSFFELFVILSCLPLKKSLNMFTPFVSSKLFSAHVSRFVLSFFISSVRISGPRDPDALESLKEGLEKGKSLLIPAAMKMSPVSKMYNEVGMISARSGVPLAPVKLRKSQGRGLNIIFSEVVDPFEFLLNEERTSGAYRKIGKRLKEVL